MKLTINEPDKLFFTGDNHFSHANIMRYARRPFDDVHDMNKAMTERWNATVPKDGIVVHVGDFMFARQPNRVRQMRERLNGKIVLVRGNHDNHDRATVTDWGVKVVRDPLADVFDVVCDLLYLTVKSPGSVQSIAVCHFALRVWDKSHFNAWHVYGHSHGSLQPQGKSYDVGVDNGTNYTPLSFAALSEIMAGLPDNPNLVRK